MITRISFGFQVLGRDRGDPITFPTWRSIGHLIVSSAGEVELEDNLYVGYRGNGVIDIEADGELVTSRAFFGYNSDAIGTVTVFGSEAMWRNSGTVFVGGDNTGSAGRGDLIVIDQGNVRSDVVTVWPDGTVTGDGTIWADIFNHGRFEAIDGTLTVLDDYNGLTRMSLG